MCVVGPSASTIEACENSKSTSRSMWILEYARLLRFDKVASPLWEMRYFKMRCRSCVLLVTAERKILHLSSVAGGVLLVTFLPLYHCWPWVPVTYLCRQNHSPGIDVNTSRQKHSSRKCPHSLTNHDQIRPRIWGSHLWKSTGVA